MNYPNYKETLKQTTMCEYPEYFRSKILKYLQDKNIIFNDKRKSNNQQILDISNINGIAEKFNYLFDNLNCFLTNLEYFEYTKAYRYCSMFRITDLDFNKIKELINKKYVYQYDENAIFNDHLNTIATTPTYMNDEHLNLIYFKFSFKLINKENPKKSIKYPVLAVIHKTLNILEIRLDTISFQYKNKEHFYKDKIHDVKSWFKSMNVCRLENIDFQSIIKYMKDNKENDVSIVALEMRRDGMVANLDSYSNKYLTIPILGELKEFMKKQENLFNKDKYTKDIKNKLENFITVIEETSDLPSVKILWIERKIKLTATHGEKEDDYSLFRYWDELGDEERMRYVTEYFIKCETELRKSLSD